MEICYYNSLESTQLYLIKQVQKGKITPPFLIYTNNQTKGIGSRGNIWQGVDGNLFFSFVIYKEQLPKDLPLSSISVYYGYIIKELLAKQGSMVYLKWPNDLYLNDKKIGGIISNKKKNLIFVGVGINLVQNNKKLFFLDIKLEIKSLFNDLINKIKFPNSWIDIFNIYKIEFHKNKKNNFVNIKNKTTDLRDCILNTDGSITINNERVYSLR